MKSLSILLSLLISVAAFAEHSPAEHYAELFKRQELIHNSYSTIYKSLTDINRREAVKTWYRLLLKDPNAVEAYNSVDLSLRKVILGKDYRQLIFYYVATGQITQAQQTFGFYFISAHTLIDNILHDPQALKQIGETLSTTRKKHKPLSLSKIRNLESCFQKKMKNKKRGYNLANLIGLNSAIERCALSKGWVQGINGSLRAIFDRAGYTGAPYPTSFAGYVDGNKVELHNQTPMKPQDIETLGEQLYLIRTALAPGMDKPYTELTIEDYKQLMPTPQAAIDGLFTEQEGFKNTTRWDSLFDVEHTTLGPINSQRLGIYGAMLQAIRDAKQSVYIDIFWMGGTLGMNLAKELFQKVVENPDFQVIIISDNENKFNYGVQLDMIYNYMRAFSEKFTYLNFYITPAHIGIKRTALPEFVDLLITNNVVNDLSANDNIKSYLKDDGFHLLAKSDHTKVMVVDGKDPELGKAFVGSKNWTDSSGGANYDEMAEVQGPAAALILNSFYYDTFEAFMLDLDSRLGGDMVSGHIQAKYPKLASNQKNRRQAVKFMLDPIDVINRHSGYDYNVSYVPKGNSIVAPTQNNIYGTEMSPIDQNIQMILSAKHQILIDDQFLYDPNVVEALKVAIQKHGVKVYAILESLLPIRGEEGPGTHIPNNLFLPELTALGAEVKWQLTPTYLLDALRKDSRKHPGQIISPTFHVKSMSVDGVMADDFDSCSQGEPNFAHLEDAAPMVISGSANKDVMTMSGGFREYQVGVYDQETVAAHDCLFWARWNDPGKSKATDGTDFILPEQAAQMGITDQETFLQVLKQVLFTPYRFTKDFF